MRKFFIPILFFVAFLIVVYLIVPQFSKLAKLQTAVADKQDELEQTANYFVNLGNSLSELSSYQEYLTTIQASLPAELSLASLLGFFQEELSKHGLILKSIGQNTAVARQKVQQEVDAKVKAKSGFIKESFIDINIKGSVVSFESFLRDIEKSSRMIEVEQIVFKGSQEEMSEMTLAIKVFHY